MLFPKKKCSFKHVTPQYIHMKVNRSNPLSMHTKNRELTKIWVTESVYEMLQHVLAERSLLLNPCITQCWRKHGLNIAKESFSLDVSFFFFFLIKIIQQSTYFRVLQEFIHVNCKLIWRCRPWLGSLWSDSEQSGLAQSF